MALFDFIGDIFGFGDDEESNLEGFELPEFEEDPIFGESQDFLFGLGKDILGGDFGAFSSLAETGSPEFEAILAKTIRDVQTSATEALAAQGRGRGGAVADVTSRAVGDVSADLRFQDFLRSQEGLGFLFQQGRGITEGVSSRSLTNQAQKNQFSLNRSGLDLEQRGLLDEQDLREGGLEGEGIGNLFESIPGIFGGIKDLFGDKEEEKVQTGVTATSKGAKKIGSIKKNRLLNDFNMESIATI